MDQNNKDSSQLYKSISKYYSVLLLGDTNVGKSHLMN